MKTLKPRTYFRVALLFPYMLWGVCALIVALISSQDTSAAWNIVLMPITFYVIGIILWLIPYTILAAGIWIWSRNKSTRSMYKLAMVAPLLLFALMFLEAMLVSLPAQSVGQTARDILAQGLLLGGFSLVFGYLCVGIAMVVYRSLQARHLITEEAMPSHVEESTITISTQTLT